jgi:hypothetical protein
MLFNQQEPLSVNSETNIENTEFLRAIDKTSSLGGESLNTSASNKRSLNNVSSFTPTSSTVGPNNQTNTNKSRDESFQNHIENCNTSLVKLVSMIHNQNEEENSSSQAVVMSVKREESESMATAALNNTRNGTDINADCSTEEFIEDVEFAYDDSQLNYDPPDFSNDQVC